MSKNYTDGLDFTWPTKGDTNWDTAVDAALEILSGHNHDGAGAGALIDGTAFAADTFDDTKLRLRNNHALRSRNAAGSADIDLIKVNASDLAELGAAAIIPGVRVSSSVVSMESTETITATGTQSMSVSTATTILNSTSISAAMAGAGRTGQIKCVVNIHANPALVAFTSPSGTDYVALNQNASLLLLYVNSAWTLFPCFESKESFSGAGTWSGRSKLVIATGTTYTITTPAGFDGQQVLIRNQASGNVTFGGQVCATGTYYSYAYLNGGWRRVAMT